MKHDLLLFDLDGTISDPAQGIGRSINYALVHYGYEPLGIEQISAHIGPPIDHTFARITGTTSEVLLRELVVKYRERYSDVGFAENIVYPHVRETLAALYASGVDMAVCTSKRRDFAERILKHFELARYFLFVDGGDVGIEKWQQIEAMRVEKRLTPAALMIGDRAVDLTAARRNGIGCGAVLWGYGSHEELQEGEPDYWFESPQDWLRLTKIPNKA
jgi:phosphoglycolate phosphatase